jgi:hypothetical protein
VYDGVGKAVWAYKVCSCVWRKRIMSSPLQPNESIDAIEIEGYETSKESGFDNYPLDELAIRDERRTAIDVVRRIQRGVFVLDPDFQRSFVWDEETQSRLIESILMRIPLPVFYVAENEDGKLVAVDGLQRLTTLDRFVNGKLKLKLEGRADLHKKTFNDLESRLQNRVEDCQLLFYIIDSKVPERARLDIFERVNSGKALTRQQMRNAIYSGPATKFLREEAESELFKNATGNSLDPKKMLDREFVNRFCSFSLLPLSQYKGDMDAWLGEGLKAFGKSKETEREALRVKLRRGLQNNLSVFGKHTFRKHKSLGDKRSVINAALFDVMMSALSSREESVVLEKKEKLQQAFYRKMEDAVFIKAITYGPNTPQEVRKRFEMIDGMMKEVFGAN